MAIGVQLSASVSTQLESVRAIQRAYNKKSEELATGRKSDDEQNQKTADTIAKTLSNQASDFLGIKDTLSQAANKSVVAQAGLQAVDKTLDQLKSLSQQYQNTTDTAAKAQLQQQFDAISQQVDNYARDSSYGGTNLISSQAQDATVQTSPDSGTAITIKAQPTDSASFNLDITDSSTIDAAQATVRAAQQSIGTDAATVQIRQDFTDKLVNTAQAGAAKLVNVDLNEVAAKSISASTRSQLAQDALALSAKSSRSILQLFDRVQH